MEAGTMKTKKVRKITVCIKSNGSVVHEYQVDRYTQRTVYSLYKNLGLEHAIESLAKEIKCSEVHAHRIIATVVALRTSSITERRLNE